MVQKYPIVFIFFPRVCAVVPTALLSLRSSWFLFLVLHALACYFALLYGACLLHKCVVLYLPPRVNLFSLGIRYLPTILQKY